MKDGEVLLVMVLCALARPVTSQEDLLEILHRSVDLSELVEGRAPLLIYWI